MTAAQKAVHDALLEVLTDAEVEHLSAPISTQLEEFVQTLTIGKPPKSRLVRMLNKIDKFLSNHDGTYQADARALWHIIGGATRGPDDEDGLAKNITINLRGLAFPRTAALGTGTGAQFTHHPKAPTAITSGPLHFRQHAQKAVEGLKRAGRI